MSDNANKSVFVLASEAFDGAVKSENQGAGLMIAGLMQYLESELVAHVKDKKGNTLTLHAFMLRDYFAPVYNAQGTEDRKLRSSMLQAIIETLIGIDTPTMRNAVAKYLPAAIVARIHGAEVNEAGGIKVPVCIALDLQVGAKDGAKYNSLGLSVLDAIKEAASLNGDEIDDEGAEKRLGGAMVPLSGAYSRTYGQLPSAASFARERGKELAIAYGYMPKPKPRAATPKEGADATACITFTKSVDFLITQVGQMVEGDECEVALSEDLIAKLQKLSYLVQKIEI